MLFERVKCVRTNTMCRQAIPVIYSTIMVLRLHWLPVRRRIDFKLACLVHLSLAGQAPHHHAEDIHLVAAGPGRQLRSSTDRSCSVTRTYSTSGDVQKHCRSRDSCVEQSAIESTRRKTQFSELQAPAENSLVYC